MGFSRIGDRQLMLRLSEYGTQISCHIFVIGIELLLRKNLRPLGILWEILASGGSGNYEQSPTLYLLFLNNS